jgi:hypothetical protein
VRETPLRPATTSALPADAPPPPPPPPQPQRQGAAEAPAAGASTTSDWPPAPNSALRDGIERRKADRLITPREVVCEGDDALALAYFFSALVEEPLPAGPVHWQQRAFGGGASGATSYEQFLEFVLADVDEELLQGG